MGKKSYLMDNPAWALSLASLSLIIVLVILLKILPIQFFASPAFDIGFYIFIALYFPVVCFYICKSHPGSVWYTPIICNSVSLLVIIFYPYTNPDSSLLIYMAGVFFLSIIGAIAGAKIGIR